MGTTYSWCQTGGPPVYPTGMLTVTSAPPSTPDSTSIDVPASASEEPAEPAEPEKPEKPEGKCNKDDASPLNVGGGDCE